MPIDERARHRLYLKLEDVLGPDEAGTLMAHLPPGGYAELVTKDDLLLTKTELKSQIESLRHELTGQMERLGRRLVMWMSGMVLATGGLAFAAGRFA
jgi:hypothetical protein